MGLPKHLAAHHLSPCSQPHCTPFISSLPLYLSRGLVCWPALSLPTAKATAGGYQWQGEVQLPGTFLRGSAFLNAAPSVLPAQHTLRAALGITSSHLTPFPLTEMQGESNGQQLQRA